MKIIITQIKDAYEFCRICSQQPFDVRLQSGRQIVDGKSQLGIFSLDLSTPTDVVIDAAADGSHDAAVDKFKSAISKWDADKQ